MSVIGLESGVGYVERRHVAGLTAELHADQVDRFSEVTVLGRYPPNRCMLRSMSGDIFAALGVGACGARGAAGAAPNLAQARRSD
ncbi:MAG: hypothetical protein OXH96_17635 [Spirochaetaceae bacterium]|nr:hypothetical protein [Spirochaetaceae bacterium]